MTTNQDKPLILGSHVYRGVKLWNFCLDSSVDALKDFEVRKDDVFIVTYPKSGTHWMTEIVNLILNDGYPDSIDRTLSISTLIMIDMRQKLPSTRAEELVNPPDMTPILEKARTAPSPRVMSLHMMPEFLPRDLEKRGKLIYVARNPKDAICSRFNVWKRAVNFDESKLDEFVKYFMTGDMTWGSWADHVTEYWKLRNEENVLFMFYEDMKMDPEKCIRQVADHLGRHLSDEVLQQVVTHSSFQGMLNTAERLSSDTENGKEGFASGDGKFNFLNKGTCGQWKSRFSVEQNEALDEWYRDKMAGTGLQFTFE